MSEYERFKKPESPHIRLTKAWVSPEGKTHMMNGFIEAEELKGNIKKAYQNHNRRQERRQEEGKSDDGAIQGFRFMVYDNRASKKTPTSADFELKIIASEKSPKGAKVSSVAVGGREDWLDDDRLFEKE